MAAERDGAARTRDELAASLDAEIERLEHDSRRENGGKPVGIQILLRAAGGRKRAAASRAQAALHREAAARDRELAADVAADELLRAVAASIMQHLRCYDVIVRLGGDEFVCSLSAEDESAVQQALRGDRRPSGASGGRRDLHGRLRRTPAGRLA